MSNTNFSTDGSAGFHESRRTTNAEHALGTVRKTNGNRVWIYVQAGEAVATGTCSVSGSYALTDLAGNYTADVAFANGEYGWARQTADNIGA